MLLVSKTTDNFYKAKHVQQSCHLLCHMQSMCSTLCLRNRVMAAARLAREVEQNVLPLEISKCGGRIQRPTKVSHAFGTLHNTWTTRTQKQEVFHPRTRYRKVRDQPADDCITSGAAESCRI